MKIIDLINKYQADRDAYLKSSYNETQLRSDFLDPFFELLGWDIKNNKGKPTNEREVLLEEPLKQDADSNTKKPDYTFRLFSERKFFAEAKKPAVHIERDNDSAKQVRRYGFTAKLKISVLSNFEHLVIYDCSKPVKETDTNQSNRVKIYHYTEYAEKFDEIKQYLSHDAVYSGQFDETWQDIEAQISLSSVDDLFLAQINEWRLILGQEIFSHNTSIDEYELNDLVQSYLNSIIFLRVCEDRQLETYKTLLNFAKQDDYSSLIKKFKQADKKYNAGLFSHSLVDNVICSNKSAFWAIIKKLYYPESTYSFAVFASDILGNIYEIFLAERLVINHSGISLQKKPDYIDRDIVTTPNHIVRDILRQTISEYCADKSDVEILNTSVADIACGSGAFLLEAYQLLHDILVDYYLKHKSEILIQTSISSYKLPYRIKKQIIENCIYGIDKDFNAVEACKFGLLLKLLEDEYNHSITMPALPDISNNIQFGNSLVEFEMASSKEYADINPYDFSDQKFDIIVGNPPYMPTEDMKQITPLELPIYKKQYISAYKQFDKYFLFIERGMSLLKDNGYLGYIIPSKLFKVGAALKARSLLSNTQNIRKIISFGANQVFKGKTTYTCLFILQNKQHNNFEYLEVDSFKKWKTRNIDQDHYASVSLRSLDNEAWVLIPERLKTTYDAILAQSERLEDVIGSENIYNGIQTSANKVYVHKALKEDNRYVYFEKERQQWKIEKELTRPYFETSRGDDNLNTYRSLIPNRFVIYPYLKSDNTIKFVDIQTLRAKYPSCYEYLISHKEILGKRDIKPVPENHDEWYRFGRHQSLDKCDVPAKIVVGVLSQGNKYAIDHNQTLISSGGTAGYCMLTLPDNTGYSIYYIQALLNSKYIEWFASLYGEVFRGGYIARGTKVLKRLPIRKIDFDNKIDLLAHDKIVEIQKSLIACQEKIDLASEKRKRVPLEREFEALQQKLDVELKNLYKLGDNDIKIPKIAEVYATD